MKGKFGFETLWGRNPKGTWEQTTPLIPLGVGTKGSEKKNTNTICVNELNSIFIE